MGRRRQGEPPRCLLHKPSGQAYSTLAKKRIYFGPHGSQEALRRYREFLDKWNDDHAKVVVARAPEPHTIDAAVQQFLGEVESAYSRAELADIKRDLGFLKRFGKLRPDEFGSRYLKDIRAEWIQRGNTRNVINRRVDRIRRFFRWMVAHEDELCQPETLAVLQAVPPLAKGKAPEPPPVEPVPREDLVRALKLLPRRIRAMAIVQLHAGPRPAEICRMKMSEIYRTGTMRVGNRTLRVPAGVWLFMPTKHKKSEEGKQAVYVMGPRCQAALKPFLKTDAEAYVFSAAEAAVEHKAARRKARKSKVQPSQIDRSKSHPRRKPGACYTRAAYYRVIERLCEKHGIPHWHPHQLRHNFVTRMDAISDLATASAAVGHSGVPTTLIYLQRKILDVAPIAARVG